jgi:predicted HicB family RNase H-like nuclease
MATKRRRRPHPAATRIPKGLHREIKLLCVSTGISVMEFVADALEDKLRKGGKRKAAAK